MKFPFLASFLILIGILTIRIRTTKKTMKEEQDSFWERERRANCTRKKSLDNLHYIEIPEAILSLPNPSGSIIMKDCLDTLQELSTLPIVNLTGFTNTDLKLTYGTVNITVLTEFDDHYTTLVTTLQKIAESLYEENRKEECLSVLEFAVSTRTDISKSYFLLASLYKELHTPEKIEGLIQIADSLRTVMKPTIVHTLKESYQ